MDALKELTHALVTQYDNIFNSYGNVTPEGGYKRWTFSDSMDFLAFDELYRL